MTYGWPDVLPDGSGVIYTAVSLSSSRVGVYDIAHAASTPLVESGAFGRYAPTGHLVFERRGRLEAAAFDAHDRRSIERAAADPARPRDERRTRRRARASPSRARAR